MEAVDEVDAAVDAAKRIARHLAKHSPVSKGAVAVSGAVDLVTDGKRTFRLPGGSAMMTKITGAGCSLGGVTATYLAVAEPLIAALSASLLYDRASEIAEAESDGPGSFQVALLDALWNVTADRWPRPKSSKPTDPSFSRLVSYHRNRIYEIYTTMRFGKTIQDFFWSTYSKNKGEPMNNYPFASMRGCFDMSAYLWSARRIARAGR